MPGPYLMINGPIELSDYVEKHNYEDSIFLHNNVPRIQHRLIGP